MGSWKGRLFAAGGVIFFILVLRLVFSGAGGIDLVVCTVPILLCIALLLFAMLSATTVLHDPVSRLTWSREAVLGITVWHTLIAGGERLPIVLPLLPSLAFPPSVITLADVATRPRQKPSISPATALFRAAILGLLARGVIHICRYRRYGARGLGRFKRAQNVYTFSLDRESDWPSVEGALESRLLKVLNSWSPTTKQGLEAQLWPEAPPIYELVRAVYEKDAASAEQWPIDLVAQDAADRGWGLLRRRLWVKRFEPGQALSERLPSELASLDAWSSQLAQAYPEFSEALNREIVNAVRSRQAQYGD